MDPNLWRALWSSLLRKCRGNRCSITDVIIAPPSHPEWIPHTTNTMLKHPILRQTRFILFLSVLLSVFLLAACQSNTTLPAPTVAHEPVDVVEPLTTDPAPIDSETQTPGELPTETLAVTTEVPKPSSTPSPTPTPEDFWQELPVIPTELSDKMREVYQKGIAMGNDPHTFTKLGDCNSMSPDFLHGFGGMYDLGKDYAYLQPAIDYFQKSFRLANQSTNPGTTTSRLLVSLWTNDLCKRDEIMLDCQYRLDNPSIAIIALGTIDAKYHQQDPEAYERNLRIIIESTLERGIVPVLATKADNIEGDNSINATIARLAMEYELPLWNFWKAVQPLENHGLKPDGEHLNSWSGPPATDFSLPISMEYGKEVKNITALQMLNFLMQQLADPAERVSPTPAS